MTIILHVINIRRKLSVKIYFHCPETVLDASWLHTKGAIADRIWSL